MGTDVFQIVVLDREPVYEVVDIMERTWQLFHIYYDQCWQWVVLCDIIGMDKVVIKKSFSALI